MRNSFAKLCISLALLCIAIATPPARGDEFVMPFTGDLYLQQMGGEAGGVTMFGLGTSPANFVPYYSGLPNNPSPQAKCW
jgi:hypothetical protein